MRHLSCLVELTNSQEISTKSIPLIDKTALEFLQKFHDFVSKMAGSSIISGLKDKYVDNYLRQYLEIPFVQALYILPVNSVEKAAFCLFIWAKISSNECRDVQDISPYWRSFTNKKGSIESNYHNKVDY